MELELCGIQAYFLSENGENLEQAVQIPLKLRAGSRMDGLLLKYNCIMSRKELCCSTPLAMKPFRVRVPACGWARETVFLQKQLYLLVNFSIS